MNFTNSGHHKSIQAIKLLIAEHILKFDQIERAWNALEDLDLILQDLDNYHRGLPFD